MQQTTPLRYYKMERLIELSRQLNQSLDLDPFLQSIVDLACELTNCESSSIFLFEEETGLLKFIAAPRAQREILRRLRVPLHNSVAGEAYSEIKPVVINDAAADSRIFREVDHMLGVTTRTILAVPLVFHQRPIGVMEAVNKRNNVHYTDNDVSILETLASYAATAIFDTLLLEETQSAYKNLQSLEKMKSDFIAIASHELRTPLGLILGHSTYLLEGETDEQRRQQLGVILQSTDRLRKIVEDLSTVDRMGKSSIHLVRDLVDMQKVVAEVTQNFQPPARQKGISIQVVIPPGDWQFEGDFEKIATVLSNLVSNAIAFTEANGHIWVRCEHMPGYIKTSVIDDGIGIPTKDLPHIFERFFQVESHFTRKHGGMGIGLSVSKTMVEMHGGQIWAESMEGKGSSFSFILPTRQGGAERSAPPFAEF